MIKKVYAVIVLLCLCVQGVNADDFSDKLTAFETTVKGKLTSFDTKFNTKMTTFETSVRGKFSSWDKNYESKMKGFETSVKSKCDSFSTNLNNKLTSFEKEVRSKASGMASSEFTSKVDAFTSSVKDDFSSLSTSVKDNFSNFKNDLKGEFGETDFAQIQDDFNTFADGFQNDWEDDITDAVADGGAVSDALNDVEDEAENKYDAMNATANVGASEFRSWGAEDGNHQCSLWIPGGHTYMIMGSSASGACFVNRWKLDYSDHWGVATGLIAGNTFSIPADNIGQVACAYPAGTYYVVMTNAGAGQTDTDNDGYSDEQETNAGTDPNDATDKPGTPVDPVKEGLAEAAEGKLDAGVRTGVEGLDLLIQKLSLNLSSLIPSGQEDYSLIIPVSFPPYVDFSITLGGWDSLLDGKVAWLRSIVRGISKIFILFVFFKAVILALRQW